MESNEFLTFVDQIITEWTGEKYHFDADERYAEQNPEKNIIIDIFPDTIVDVDKFYQVDIFYRKWIDGDISKEVFLENEKKYLNFINLLWLYNTVDISYNLYHNCYFRKGIKKYSYSSLFKRSSVKNIQRNVNDWNTLEEKARLALREAGFLWVYFRQWEIIAIICDFSIRLLFKDDHVIPKIQPLVERSLLYVQPIKK